MKALKITLILAILLLVAVGSTFANKANAGAGINITITPKTLILSKDLGSVSVHSNLPLSLVVADSVQLEGITPYLVKADDLGHLVAKFNDTEIKEILQPGSQTMTLTGLLKDGTSFAASDTVTTK